MSYPQSMATADYNFISQPDPNLKCTICLELAHQPKQCEDCGKLFCSECIEKNGKRPCPNCRVKNPRYFKDIKSDRDIKEINVRCTSIERGCPWNGTIGTLYAHLGTCQFALVPCPNKCEDDKDAGEIQLVRKDLDDHLKTKCLKRILKCQHCGEKGTYASITGDHDKVCAKKIVACPNQGSGCRLSVERGMTNQHVSACEYTETACTYESLGCGVRMLKKDIIKHQENDDKKHLHLMLRNYSALAEQRRTLSEGEALVFKLSEYASKKENNMTFCTIPFYTHPGGYKICIRVYANGNGDGEGKHVSVFAKIMEGHYDDHSHWPFLGGIKYELLNQLADNRHIMKVDLFDATAHAQVSYSQGYTKFLPHSSLCLDPATNTQYLLEDTLYFRVSVKVDNHKPWLVCNDKINTDTARATSHIETLKYGDPFVFQLTKYNSWKALNEVFYSDSFYTSPGGYKMSIRVNPNGCGSGEGTHVSVFAQLLEGSRDASLPWPFKGTVKLTLLNQLSDENHYNKTTNIEATKDGFIGNYQTYVNFIPQSTLSHDPVKNTQYLKNDTLYFRVFVKDSTTKPWLACTYN